MIACRRTRLPAVSSEQFSRADVRVIVLNDWLALLVVVPGIWSVFTGGCASTLTAPIPPSPDVLWQPPDLRPYTHALKRPESPILDREKRYELVELIDLAERVNPETRVVWERARQAAAVVGLAESEYFPILVLHASAGGQSIPFPIPTDVVPEGFFRADNLLFNPTLALRWLLFDFGRRRATLTAATEQLLAS